MPSLTYLAAYSGKLLLPWNVDDTSTGSLPGYEAATQTFKMGDILKASSGQLSLAIATGSNITTAVVVAGVAEEQASGTTNNIVKFTPFTSGVLMKLPVYHGTPSSAVTAVSQLYLSYPIRNDATYGYMLDISTTTNGIAKMVAIAPDEAVGAAYGYVYVMIAASNTVIA